jgi:hypothetical protein
MKKLFFLAILGMSTLAFSQSYTYLPYGGTAYAVPDANADELSELLQTAGQKFTKFDRTIEASGPTDDKDKTFGNNNPAPTDGAGTDQDRGWLTTGTSVTDPGYYSVYRSVNAILCARAPGLWAYHTVNFTETANYNLLLRARDGSKTNEFVISIYSPTDMATPLYTKTTNFTGAVPGGESTDGTAKYLVLNGTTGSNASVWYKIQGTFTPPAVGNYIVKISQTTTSGTVSLGSFTFWKEAAATAPEVALTAPITNSVVEEGSTITLTAKVTPGDGIVSGVEFFDNETSLGMGTDAGSGFYTKDVMAVASKVYNFKAKVTETGGVAPDTKESFVVKVMSIGIAEDNFNGTTYPGKPWNNTAWMFGTDNVANLAVGSAYVRVPAVEGITSGDKYIGVPFFAYDLGAVNNTIDKSPTSLRYVAGSSINQSSTSGVDARLANIGSNVFSFSDTYSREVTTIGSGRFLASATDYRFSTGGAWARYSCKFAAGKYKLILRATDNCNANYNIYARFLRADGTVLGNGIYTFNAGNIAAGCVSELNVTKLAGNAAYAVLTVPSATNQWVMVNDELSLDGDVIVELSDPDPLLGGNSPGPGVFGEFTFEYVGATAVKNVQDNNFKTFITNKALVVECVTSETTNVSVYNVSGNLILNKPMLNGKLITELPVAGVYFVKLHNKGNTLVKRVIVK